MTLSHRRVGKQFMQYVNTSPGMSALSGICRKCGEKGILVDAVISIIWCDHGMDDYDFRKMTKKELKGYKNRLKKSMTVHLKKCVPGTIYLKSFHE